MSVYIKNSTKSFLMINRYNTYIMENNMSDTMHDGILDNIRSIDKNGTLLDILLEIGRASCRERV